jgi:hypothetical protein
MQQKHKRFPRHYMNFYQYLPPSGILYELLFVSASLDTIWTFISISLPREYCMNFYLCLLPSTLYELLSVSPSLGNTVWTFICVFILWHYVSLTHPPSHTEHDHHSYSLSYPISYQTWSPLIFTFLSPLLQNMLTTHMHSHVPSGVRYWRTSGTIMLLIIMVEHYLCWMISLLDLLAASLLQTNKDTLTPPSSTARIHRYSIYHINSYKNTRAFTFHIIPILLHSLRFYWRIHNDTIQQSYWSAESHLQWHILCVFIGAFIMTQYSNPIGALNPIYNDTFSAFSLAHSQWHNTAILLVRWITSTMTNSTNTNASINFHWNA